MTNLKRRGTHTLTIGGKEVNLLFNMRFWGLLDEAGYKLEELPDHFSQGTGIAKMMKVLVAVFTCAGQSYAKSNKTEWEYDEDDIYDWFEEDITEDVLKEIMEALTNSKIMGNSLSDKAVGKQKGKK